MFTRKELAVLRDALVYYREDSFEGRHTKYDSVSSLIERFEEILSDYSDMENKYKLDEAPFGYSK